MAKKTLTFEIDSHSVHFPIFVSDDFYNYALQSTSAGQIIDTYGELTPVGMALDEHVNFSTLALLIGYGTENPPDYLHPDIFPMIDTMKWESGDSGTNIPETRVNSVTLSYSVLIVLNIDTHVEWRDMQLKINDTAFLTNNGGGGPPQYAGIPTFGYVYDRTPSGYTVSFIIVNEDFTQCRTGILTFNSNGSTNVGFGSYPYQNLSLLQQVWGNLPDDPTPGPTPGDDPYAPGGTTGDDETDPTGGDGDHDGESDDIAIPLPPTNSAVDSGFITLYNPTMAEIQALGAFMWSDLFDLDTFKKLFGDPMGAILGLSLVPVQPPQGSTVEVKIGNVLSGIRMKTISNQFIQKDFGTITLNEYWGGYLDYSPYTQVEVYLPFIGVKPLSVDDVMGKSIHLVYNIDLLSGACMAFIAANEDVLYQFIGQCACSVPITGSDWTNVINGVLGIAGAIGTTVATGGLSAPQAIGAVTALASSVASSKPRVEKSGSLSGMGGMLGVFSPYLIITRPRQALPASQNAFEGYPAFITRTLGTVSGFTRVREVHLDGMTCTDQEKDEIKRLLDEGVIF